MVALVDQLRRDRGLTVLVSLHTPEDIGGTADLMAFIADGRVAAVDRPAVLLAPGRNAAVDRYLGSAPQAVGSR